MDLFKNFVHTNQQGGRVELGRNDFKGPEFKSFANGEGAGKILCNFKFVIPTQAKFAGGLPDFTGTSVELKLVRPKFIDWRVKTGPVTLNGDNFQFGGNGMPGQRRYDAVYELEEPFGLVGQGTFCQLITPDRHLYRTTTRTGEPTHFVKATHSGVQCLDAGFPYPYSNNYGGAPPKSVLGYYGKGNR